MLHFHLDNGYIIALAFYKHWLHSQYDVMNGSLIERAFATAGKPWYWFFLLTGFAFIILLVCMGVHLFRKDKSVLGNLVGLILNIVLIVILVTVFWDPIFTTFVVSDRKDILSPVMFTDVLRFLP